jgi:hypothetical protein
MGLMLRRAVPVGLLAALLGVAAGTAVSAVPPLPTVSLPTVTVPLPPPPVEVPLPAPVPAPPPPPAVTVPPMIEPPPLPVPQAPPAEAPAYVTRTVPPAPAPRPETGGAGDGATGARPHREPARKPSSSPRPRPLSSTAPTAPAAPRATGIRGASAAVQGPLPEDGGFLGPIGATVGALDDPRAIPGALFAMALLAVFLLTLASMPTPVRTSRAGAMLVHKRGSITFAGCAALALAVGTYLLL